MMSKLTSDLAGLVTSYPWPGQRPDAPVSEWGWGIEGRELLDIRLPTNARVVVEIGSLLGSSARYFAERYPSAHIFCIDPWFDVDDPKDRPFLEHAPELTDFVTSQEDGIYQIFLASNWELRDRLTPLRGFSPDMLTPINRAGIDPDVVYIDGSHTYEDVIADIVTARALFPTAVLCGDDWDWPGVKHAVSYVARNRGDEIHSLGNTWLLDHDGSNERHPAPSARTVGPVERSALGKLASRVATRGK